MKTLIDRLLSVSLKFKVVFGYAAVSVFIFGVMGFAGLHFLKIKSRYDSMYAISSDMQLITQLKADVNGVRAAFLRMAIADGPDIRDNQEAVISSYAEKCDEILGQLKKGAYKDRIGEIEKTWRPFKDTIFNEMVPLVKRGKMSEAVAILGSVQSERSKEFIGIANEIIENSRKDFEEGKNSVQRDVESGVRTVLTVFFVIFTLAFILSFWFVNRFVIAVLKDISLSAEKVAAGDLTVDIRAKTGDDFGKLAVDVSRIIKSMRYVMRDVANKTVVVLKDATSLTLYGKDVSHRVEKDLGRTTSAAAATEEMSATVAEIANSINSASMAAEKARAVSVEGKKTVDETVSSIEEVNNQIEKASGKVKDLAEFSKKIDDIVVMIKDIADQTNLLALNAAIEAARAGEQGRGFAVVADEVRKLATRTANATSEITGILGSIHSGTVDATSIMDTAVEKARGTGDLALRLDSAFAEISSSFGQVSDMVSLVVTATEEQSATASELSRTLATIADDARESTRTVKDMALSSSRFSNDAKEFLKLLDGFHDMKMRIGVLKADYVLWLNRMLDLLDVKGGAITTDELHAERSRMGIWYFGEGRRIFGDSAAFRELAAPHNRLHELGMKAYDASRDGDREAVGRYVKESVQLTDSIIAILGRLESEVWSSSAGRLDGKGTLL